MLNQDIVASHYWWSTDIAPVKKSYVNWYSVIIQDDNGELRHDTARFYHGPNRWSKQGVVSWGVNLRSIKNKGIKVPGQEILP
jgi:hypothetical protein